MGLVNKVQFNSISSLNLIPDPFIIQKTKVGFRNRASINEINVMGEERMPNLIPNKINQPFSSWLHQAFHSGNFMNLSEHLNCSVQSRQSCHSHQVSTIQKFQFNFNHVTLSNKEFNFDYNNSKFLQYTKFCLKYLFKCVQVL